MDKHLTRTFALCAAVPLLGIAVLYFLQTYFALDTRALWFSDEIRYANVFEHVINAKKWLVMYLNGVPYPDKPPVYFWFLGLFLPVYGGATPALFMTGAAVSGFLFIAAAVAMNKFILRGGRELSLGCGLVLLCCFYFIGLTHYSRMDLLFAALITASHICLYHAWQKEYAPKLTTAGFLLIAVATLTKGPLSILFVLVSGAVFLAWRGNARRLLKKDVAIGFGLCLGVLLLWVAAAWFGGEKELIKNIFYKQIYRRAVNASHHEQPFWHYFATFPLAWLPWTFMIFVLPIKKIFTAAFWKELTANRKTADPGETYLWIVVVSGFILLSSLSTKIIVYLMPLFPALSILTAKGLMALDEQAHKRLYICIGGLFAFVATALPFGNFFHPWPIHVEGLWLVALVSVAAAFVLWRWVRPASPKAALMAMAIIVTAWTQPLMLITMPSLNGAMSPKAQGELMGDYIRHGYKPAAYKIYSGVYTYYCGTNIWETQDLPAIEKMVRSTDKVVLGMQKRYWKRWETRPESLQVVHEQFVVDRPYVLLVKGPKELTPTSE